MHTPTHLSHLTRFRFSSHFFLFALFFCFFCFFFFFFPCALSMVCVCLSLCLKDGYTPLILASAHGRTPTVELLLEVGANTEAKCNVRDRVI